MIAIRKARAEDATSIWQIRTAAILHQCAGHYPAESLAIWTEGEVTDEFIQMVAKHWYVATIDDFVVGAGMIDCQNGHLD